jgi:hypothetical protein
MIVHVSRSPSKRHRWRACAGSVREEAKYPDERSNATAIDGTHTHTTLNTCVEAGMVDASQYIGQHLSDQDGEFVVDAARAERVNFALDYIRKRASLLGGQIISEDEVQPFPLVGRFDLSGHVDVQIVGEHFLEVIDYKDGMAIVDAKDNPQLEQYAMGCVCAHQDKDFHTIRLTIIQPKLREKGMEGISYQEISFTTLMDKVQTIIAEAAATDDPNAPLTPGEEQCKYCKAKGACGALAQHTMAASGIRFEDLTKQQEEPVTLSDQRLREVMEAAPLIRQFLEGAEKEAQRRLEAGHAIDGLKLVRGRGTRDWSMEADAIAERLKKMGLPKEVIWETKLISPAKAEKVCWKKGDEEKRLSERQIKMLQSEYIKKTEGKVTIALASDDRPAVTSTVAGMFQPVIADLPDFLKPKE